MNAVAQAFVDAYENDRDITPKELIDAGWTYKYLTVYIYQLSIAEANHKRDVLKSKLYTLEMNEPDFYEDETLKDFSSVHKYGKQIGIFIQDQEDFEGEIDGFAFDEQNGYVKSSGMAR